MSNTTTMGKWLNYTRCRRADGTHYGTAGVCRKGSEDPLTHLQNVIKAAASGKNQLTSDRMLGQGKYGRAYDIGNGVIVKYGEISGYEIGILKSLESVPEVPRVIASNIDPNRRKETLLAMTKATGTPLYKMPLEEQEEAWNNFLPSIRKIHKQGVAHNDLHEGNVFYNKKDKKFGIIDFGLSTRSQPADQIEDLLEIAAFSSRSREKALHSIIYKHFPGNTLGKIYSESPKVQQAAVNRVWDDIDRAILSPTTT